MVRRVSFSIAAAFGMALLCGTASTANAVSVSGATEVLITNPLPDFIQVGEVIATELVTGTDVALTSEGGSAIGSSTFNVSSTPDKAIDGIYPANYPNIFHSGNPFASEYLSVTLGHASNLSSLTIYGRGTGGNDRDLYLVTIFNGLGGVLYSGVLDARTAGFATVTFDAPAAVPVPAALPLFASGLGLLTWCARRRKKSAAV